MATNSRHSFHDVKGEFSTGSVVLDERKGTPTAAPRAAPAAAPAPAAQRARGLGLLAKIAIGLGLLLLLIAVVGFFVVPPLAKNYLVKTLGQQLGRQVAIQDIDFNPFAMTGVVKGITIYEPRSSQIFASIDELALNLEFRSILQRAPVLKRVHVGQPYLHVVRFRDGKTYNFSDLLTKFAAAPKQGAKPSEPLRFALNNIEIRQGRVDFDDRPVPAKHVVSEINAAIPFISNLPYYLDDYVQPAFSAKVNGTPVALAGRTKPFKDSHETSLDLDVTRLELPRYFPYVPLDLKFKMPSGLLSTDLTLAFVSAKGQAPLLRLYGSAKLEQLALTERDGAPLLKLAALDVPIQSVDVFGQRYAFGAISVRSPEVFVRRGADSQLNWLQVLPEQAGGKQGGEGKMQLAIAEVRLADGSVHLVDEVPPKGFRGDLTGIQGTMLKLALPQSSPR